MNLRVEPPKLSSTLLHFSRDCHYLFAPSDAIYVSVNNYSNPLF